jgi:hypothetical protein
VSRTPAIVYPCTKAGAATSMLPVPRLGKAREIEIWF